MRVSEKANTGGGFLERVMEETGTGLSRDEFIREANVVYHEFEAKHYDEEHLQIWGQGKDVWNRLLDGLIVECGPGRRINMLDFGAGTGFASQQIIEKLGHDRFESITLVEPSDEMARIGLDRLSAFGLPIERVERILDTESEFEIVCVNSVLHHLSDPVTVINRLGALIARRGLFLVAQEPNVRYHSSLVGIINRGARRILGVMRPPGAPGSPNQRMLAISDELVRRGITPLAMKPAEIGLVVDYWVPRPNHSERSTERLGFGVNGIAEALGQRFTVSRTFTYDFLGKPTVFLPRFLAFLDFLVGFAFPKSGQQIAAVFQKIGDYS